jgi:hypothetical protein
MPKVTKTVLKLILWSGLTTALWLFSCFPNLVLNYYSNGFYPILSAILRNTSTIVPFALGDFLYLILVGLALYLTISFLKKYKLFEKQTLKITTLKLLNLGLVLYLSFKILWGLNYSRPSIANQLHIKKEKYSVKELVLLGNYFVNKLNELKPKTTPNLTYTIEQLQQKSAVAYQLSAQKNPFFKSDIKAVKPVLNSYFISKIGIEGYYNPLSGEANINMDLPPWVLPFVTCHEIAHQLGVAKEDEANLVGYWVCVNSKDTNFQYSANYNMLRYILYEIRIKSPEDYEKLLKKISPAVIENFKSEEKFWAQYNGQMSNYMGFIFDKFLKINNQKKGINSYQDIVIWLWNIHRPLAPLTP